MFPPSGAPGCWRPTPFLSCSGPTALGRLAGECASRVPSPSPVVWDHIPPWPPPALTPRPEPNTLGDLPQLHTCEQCFTVGRFSLWLGFFFSLLLNLSFDSFCRLTDNSFPNIIEHLFCWGDTKVETPFLLPVPSVSLDRKERDGRLRQGAVITCHRHFLPSGGCPPPRHRALACLK